MVKRVADRIVIDILKDAIRDVSCHILIPETQREIVEIFNRQKS